MKKLATILILALLLGSLGAQEMAWINPKDATDLTFIGALPGSMLNYVSDGIFYDEWDVVFHAPAELSNYTGVNLLTSYGNFGSWSGAYGAVNPFTTTTFTPAPFMVGVSMPVLKYRAAAIGGFDFGAMTININDRNADGTTLGTEKATSQVVTDAFTLGAIDYTRNLTYTYSDYSQISSATLAGGIDLGFLGASIGMVLKTNSRVLGGHYAYTYTHGTDTGYAIANNTITAASINYGSSNGAAAMYGNDGGINQGNVGLLAELPTFKNFPITAELDVSWSNSLWDSFSAANLPVYYSTTTSTVAGVAGSTGTYSYTTASGASTGWTNAFPALTSGPLAAATLFGDANTHIAANPLHMSGTSSGNLMAGLKAGVDPSIKLADNIKLVARGKLGYSFGIEPTKTAYESASTYRSPINANAAQDIQFTMAYSASGSSTTYRNKISSELGGVFEFSGANGALTLGTGFFALPSFGFDSSVNGTATSTRTQTFIDQTNSLGAADMIAATGGAAVDGILTSGTPYRGTAALTQTVTYTGSYNENKLDLNFVLPFSAKVNFEKAKLQLVGGYDISMDVGYHDVSDNRHTSNVAYSGITLTNATGASTYTAPAGATTLNATTNTTYSGGWNTTAASGTAKWMLRWDPLSSMTVDFLGSSVITALNFNIFGGAGFNPANLVNSLSMSITFHF